MSGINSGILTNAQPLSAAAIKEVERRVLETREAFAYLDEKGELCFALPHGVDAIKELAWNNAYEVKAEGEFLSKKHYKKTDYDRFELVTYLQKQPTDDDWSAVEGKQTLVLAETTYNGFVYEPVYAMCSISSVYPAQFTLQAGHTYKVIWDGVEYVRRAWQAEYAGVANSSMVCLGYIPGVDASNTGEPFGVNYVPYLNNNNIFATTEGSHTITIYELSYENEGDAKVILAEQAVSGFVSGGDVIVGVQAEIVAGKAYKVMWDGAEYTCTAYEAKSYFEDGGYIYITFVGNEAFVKWYLSGSTAEMPAAVEPFAINMLPLGETGGALMVNLMCGAQFLGGCASDTHTVAIYEV